MTHSPPIDGEETADPAVSEPPAPPQTLLSREYLLTTVGMFALIFLAAFESLAVTTVMPGISRELDGERLFALAFAAPPATGIVGMVVAGLWSDRKGSGQPLIATVLLFAAGLVICGFAPTMEVLVLGRLVQGFGAGGSIVALYVMVGVIYPTWLRPRVFASFAAAWVLPALIGPPVAAFIAHRFGWEWVFLGAVVLATIALGLCIPAVRSMPEHHGDATYSGGAMPILLSLLVASGVLGINLSTQVEGLGTALGVGSAIVVVLAVRRLLPRHTSRAGRGLPSTILTRGALSAAFFTIEAYIPFALQDNWDFSPTQAGLALTVAGITWASASQWQGRVGDRLAHPAAMLLGASLVAAGAVLIVMTTYAGWPAWLLIAGYGVTSVGMGIAFARTTVAMLGASTDADRGFNSSALSIADSLGAALAITIAGIAYALSPDSAVAAHFGAVFVVGTICAALAVLAARRTA